MEPDDVQRRTEEIVRFFVQLSEERKVPVQDFRCVIFAFRSGPVPFVGKKQSSLSSTGFSGRSAGDKGCISTCSCNGSVVLGGSDFEASASSMSLTSRDLNGGGVEMLEAPKMVTDRQTGASMMEQLMPEITTHALSYLDYPSLCRLSMTNSLMRKAANDDSVWKALYHKDFTLERHRAIPVNGWKAFYAETRAIVNINAKFFDIIRRRSFSEMSSIWLNADCVSCTHASGELSHGYNAVMRSWLQAFDWWEDWFNFQVCDIQTQVFRGMAWVTLKTYDVIDGPVKVTNVFELHNDRWYMVHHHCLVMLMD